MHQKKASLPLVLLVLDMISSWTCNLRFSLRETERIQVFREFTIWNRKNNTLLKFSLHIKVCTNKLAKREKILKAHLQFLKFLKYCIRIAFIHSWYSSNSHLHWRLLMHFLSHSWIMQFVAFKLQLRVTSCDFTAIWAHYCCNFYETWSFISKVL